MTRTGESTGDSLAVLESLAAHAPLPMPRVLLVFAHPDDETLAVGARLERFRASRFLCVTDGAPRDGADAAGQGFPSAAAYSAARWSELGAAFRHAALDPTIADHLRIGEAETVVADKEAAYALVELTLAILREIKRFAPEAVLTHPYEGGHPDHDSCAFAVHAAVRLLGSAASTVYESPFYHAKPDGMETGCFLTFGTLLQPPMRLCELSPEELRNKQARLACFRTQAAILANFGTTHEFFRLAPAYDFTQPPHPGELLYERWGWEIKGERFRALAAEALQALGLSPA